MISSVEKSKSNKSSCQLCKKKIGTGDFRGVDRYNSFGHIKKKYFCRHCSIEVLGLCKNSIEGMLTELT